MSAVVPAEPTYSGAPLAVSSLQRGGRRVIPQDARPVSRTEGIRVTQLAEVLERRERRLGHVFFRHARGSARFGKRAPTWGAARPTFCHGDSPPRERRPEDEGGRRDALMGATRPQTVQTWGAGDAAEQARGR